MKDMSQLSISHGERDARVALAEQLRRRYLDLFTRYEYMITIERDTLYTNYIMLIGQDKFENFKLAVEVRGLKMKVELAQAAVNRDERPDVDAIEQEVIERMDRYYQAVAEQAEALQAANEATMIPPETITEARNVYRVLVKRLHPDLHPEQSEETNDLFIKAQAAYHNLDVKALREILLRIDVGEPISTIADKVDLETLENTIQRLQEQIARLEEKIGRLDLSFPFVLRDKITDPEWIAKQKEELATERKRLEELRDKYTDRFRLLTDL